MSEKENNGGFGWDDKIDPQQAERKLLPEGEAIFTVLKLERQRKEFGKYGVQNVAVVTLLVASLVAGSEGQEDELQVQLPLVVDLKWKLVQFCTAIGQRKHGETALFAPNYAKMEGEMGRCLIEHRPYISKKERKAAEDEKREPRPFMVADIAKFLAPADAADATDNLNFG